MSLFWKSGGGGGGPMGELSRYIGPPVGLAMIRTILRGTIRQFHLRDFVPGCIANSANSTSLVRAPESTESFAGTFENSEPESTR